MILGALIASILAPMMRSLCLHLGRRGLPSGAWRMTPPACWSSSAPRRRVGVRESAQSWRELLVDLKARGLAIAPQIAVGDGALGFWKAWLPPKSGAD